MTKQGSAYVKHHGGEKVHLTGLTIQRDTANAILVKMPNTGEEIWFPLSQVDKIVRSPNKGEDELIVSDWIAKQKGLR